MFSVVKQFISKYIQNVQSSFFKLVGLILVKLSMAMALLTEYCSSWSHSNWRLYSVH